MDRERNLFQKIVLIILLVMTLLFTGVLVHNRSKTGIAFDDKLLQLQQEGEKAVYSGRVDGDTLTVSVWEEDGGHMLDFAVGQRYHALCRVEFPEGTVTTESGGAAPRIRILRDGELLFSGGYNPKTTDGSLKYFNEDGSWEPFLRIRASTSSDPWYGYEISAADILYLTLDAEPATQGDVKFFLLTVVIAIVAAVMTAFPETLYRWQHFFTMRDSKPADFYYSTHYLGCTALVVATFVGYFIAVTSAV